MFLSDKTIKEYLILGKIKISPEMEDFNIRPTGIRLHLDKDILIPQPNQVIDFENPNEVKYDRADISIKQYCLKKGDFILCSTIEKIQTTKDLVCILDGRSTTARLGLTIHCTAFTFDNNYDEQRTIVLEISNKGPFDILIKNGIPVGLLLFAKLTDEIQQESQKQYANQTTVMPPNLLFKKNEKE